jgi:2-oxoglutarate ferredoxin oxidoreductase subunit beta
MQEITKLVHKYLRHDKKFPHVWCPGCGNGIVLGALIRAIDRLGFSKDEVVLVSGIGCSGRLPVYVDFNTLHTTHGRALTFATGIKLAKPGLTVIVIMGDGDATAIGGNHFIHAARRNLDLSAIIINNSTYGMTGGQYSPTTPHGAKATTAPYRNIEHAFSIAELAVTAGAVFVGRGTVYHAGLLDQLIEKAIVKRGFGVVEVISHCHTQFGRRNEMGSPVAMMRWQKEHAVRIEQTATMSGEELKDKFSIGVLVDRDLPIYTDEYDLVRAAAKERAEAERAKRAGRNAVAE